MFAVLQAAQLPLAAVWDGLRSDSLMFIGFWVLVVVSGLATVGISAWRKHAAAKMDMELKLEMLSRGMSADDIERVLSAKSSRVDLEETQPYAKK